MRSKWMNRALSAVLLTAGCGGMSQSDVSRVASRMKAKEQASRLVLTPGEAIAYKGTESATSENGTVSTSGTFNSSSANLNEKKWTRVSKVMSTTYVESADVNGFVISSVERVTEDNQTSSTGTTNLGIGLDSRSTFVLFEWLDWVRQIDPGQSADLDENPGDALFPIATQKGLVYTDDQGEIWDVTGEGTLLNEPMIQMAQRYAASPVKLADLFALCFDSVSGAAANSVNISLNNACTDADGPIPGGNSARFTQAYSYQQVVGTNKRMLLKQTLHREVIQIDEICCGASCNGFGAGLSSCPTASVISFQRGGGPVRVTSDMSFEAFKFLQVTKDKSALPAIEDAN